MIMLKTKFAKFAMGLMIVSVMSLGAVSPVNAAEIQSDLDNNDTTVAEEATCEVTCVNNEVTCTGDEATSSAIDEETPVVVDEGATPVVDEVTPPAVDEVTPATVDEVTPPAVDEVTPPAVDEVTPVVDEVT